MKKMIFSLLAIAATMNVMAVTFTSKAKLTITAGTSASYMTIGESADAPETHLEMNFTNRPIALYVIQGTKKYQTVIESSIKELQLGLKTNAETSYTLTASDVTGIPFRIKMLDGTIFEATEGATVTFTAPASQAEITGMMVNPIEPAFCHQYGHLIINGHQGESLVVKDLAGNEKINIASLPTNEEVVELTTLTAGEQYKVSLNGAEPVIIRK